MSNALDIQVGGNHYKGFKIQPVEFSTVNGLSFIQGSMLKYLCRYNKPGGKGIQDLDKVIHYAELAKQFLTTTGNNAQPAEQATGVTNAIQHDPWMQLLVACEKAVESHPGWQKRYAESPGTLVAWALDPIAPLPGAEDSPKLAELRAAFIIVLYVSLRHGGMNLTDFVDAFNSADARRIESGNAQSGLVHGEITDYVCTLVQRPHSTQSRFVNALVRVLYIIIVHAAKLQGVGDIRSAGLVFRRDLMLELLKVPGPVGTEDSTRHTAAQSPMTLHTSKIYQWAGLNLPNTPTAHEIVDTFLKKVNGLQPVPLTVLREAYVAVLWTSINSGIAIGMFDIILLKENAECIQNNNVWPGPYARVEDRIAIYVAAIRDAKFGKDVRRVSAALGPVLYYLLTKINEECSGPFCLHNFCKGLLQTSYEENIYNLEYGTY